MNSYKCPDIDGFKELLKKNSLKATPQRLAVHSAMMRLGHACADMVTEEIRKTSDTNVTIATVYNILTQLADLGIYKHRMSSNNKMYFDVNAYRHMHIYDCENHTYKDLVDDQLMDLIEEHLRHRKFRGFSIESIDLQLVAKPTRRRARKNA